MINVSDNISLKPYTTFGIDAKTKHFVPFSSVDELTDALDRVGSDRLLVLGGGSNLLLTGDFDGWTLKNELKGVELIDEDEDYVYVKAAAGQSWNGFVQHAIDRDWAGIENLSLIPGNVGAAPMQNIGAYGVEIKDVFYELEAFDREERRVCIFTLNDCEFGYRESVFKGRFKNRFVILSVTFRLCRKPVFHTGYGAITQELTQMGVEQLSIRYISEAVIRIRQSKLPDPAQIGNAGSFFKNPTVSDEQFERLQAEFMDIVGHHVIGTDTTKLAAGWLIEQCGWKGFRRGDAGVHARQALVLVNYGNAKGEEIYSLSGEIVKSVEEKFGVRLEREVNII